MVNKTSENFTYTRILKESHTELHHLLNDATYDGQPGLQKAKLAMIISKLAAALSLI